MAATDETRIAEPRLRLVDELLYQSVDLIELKLQLCGALELQVELLANFQELIINQCEHFGGAHFGSCRSRGATFTLYTAFPLRAAFAPHPAFTLCASGSAFAAFTFHRVIVSHSCSRGVFVSSGQSDARRSAMTGFAVIPRAEVSACVVDIETCRTSGR
jgi:hypothetical protein